MSDRVVLVTGGSRGIGLACARWFQEAGDTVAVTYRSDPPPLESPGGKPLHAIRCDVTVAEDVESCLTDIEAGLGPVEVLVCNAGITDDALLPRLDEERWARVIETDLTACYRVTRRSLSPMIRARRGRIVLVSSVVGMTGNPGQTNYAAAKAGLIGFGRSLAREVASRAITVNVIAPGMIETDMLAGISENHRSAMTAQVPLGRVGTAAEVAALVGFLASDDASYITGAVVPIDGGLGMGH